MNFMLGQLVFLFKNFSLISLANYLRLNDLNFTLVKCCLLEKFAEKCTCCRLTSLQISGRGTLLPPTQKLVQLGTKFKIFLSNQFSLSDNRQKLEQLEKKKSIEGITFLLNKSTEISEQKMPKTSTGKCDFFVAKTY